MKSVGDSGETFKLSGVADYSVGRHTNLGMFGPESCKELHLVAVEAKSDWAEDSYWQCVAQVAALYRSRKLAGKASCRVWGIISNATHWRFLSIGEDGQLSQSKEYFLELENFGPEAVLLYRLVHHIVKLCFKASPPSTPNDDRTMRRPDSVKVPAARADKPDDSDENLEKRARRSGSPLSSVTGAK